MCVECLLQQWQKVPIDSVTSRNPFDMRWMDSFGRLPHSRLYKTSPKHFLSAMYSIYNYTVFVCVLIIVCDSWQAYKRYTINLPIECFSVPVSEILYPVFPTYRGDNGKCVSVLLLSVGFSAHRWTLERIQHSDSMRIESTLKAFIELARIEHFHHKPAHLVGF